MCRILATALLVFGLAQESYGQPSKYQASPKKDNANSQPLSTPVNNPTPEVDNAAEAERKREQQERDAKEESLKTQQLNQNRIIVWATVAMAIIAAFNFVVAVLYVVYASKTLKAIKEQSGHAGDQVKAMERQGTAMQGQLDAIVRQEGHMRSQAEAALKAADMAMGQLEAMRSQERAEHDALAETRKIVDQNERTIKATEKSVDVAEKTSIYSQRAYVVAKIRGVGNADEFLGFRLRFENSGNTPANRVIVTYDFGLRETPPCTKIEGTELMECDSGYPQIERLGVVAPKASYHVISTPGFITLLPEQRQKWEMENLRFYCWGRIYYETIFDEKRHTDFCFYQSANRHQGYPCEYGNEAI